MIALVVVVVPRSLMIIVSKAKKKGCSGRGDRWPWWQDAEFMAISINGTRLDSDGVTAFN
jgi:hypothetical protein